MDHRRGLIMLLLGQNLAYVLFFLWRKFQKEVSKIIRNASELREQADYEDFYEATQEEASDVFDQACG